MKAIELLCIVAAAGCAHEEPGQTIIVQPPAVVLEARGAASASDGERAPSRDVSRIQVLPSKRPDRPAEVIGVVDAHAPAGDQERALSLLRAKAAELGADAVIGVDFEHGEGNGKEPVHLSGLAIRYAEAYGR